MNLKNIITKTFIIFAIFTIQLFHVSFPYESTAKAKLANEAVILVKEDYKMDIVAINIMFKVGLKQEEAQTSGATNLIKELLFKDDENSSYISEALEALGATLTIEVMPDYFNIQCFTNKENFNQTLDLLYSGIANQNFEVKMLEMEKGKVLKILKDPYGSFGTIYDFFLQNFYQNHPYKLIRLGTSTSIKNIDTVILSGFYHRYFSPSNMVISVCGNINKTTAINQLSKKFALMPKQSLPLIKIDWEPPSRENTLFLNLKSNLSWVMFGYPAPSFKSPDYPIMLLIKNYITEGTSSRIWISIRETEGLAYDLGGIFPQLEGPSHFIIYVITEPNNTWVCRKKIANEISNLKSIPLDYPDLEKIKEKTLAKYSLSRERVTSQAEATAIDELFGLDYTYDERLKDEILAVTPSDIKRVANIYLVNPTIILAKPVISIQDMF